MVHLTRTMAIELGEHGILVNCVAPGSTLTEGTKQLFYSENAAEKDRAKRVLSHIPLGRAGTVERNGTRSSAFLPRRRVGISRGRPCPWTEAGAREVSSAISKLCVY